jgi:hypothetical protein
MMSSGSLIYVKSFTQKDYLPGLLRFPGEYPRVLLLIRGHARYTGDNIAGAIIYVCNMHNEYTWHFSVPYADLHGMCYIPYT